MNYFGTQCNPVEGYAKAGIALGRFVKSAVSKISDKTVHVFSNAKSDKPLFHDTKGSRAFHSVIPDLALVKGSSGEGTRISGLVVANVSTHTERTPWDSDQHVSSSEEVDSAKTDVIVSSSEEVDSAITDVIVPSKAEIASAKTDVIVSSKAEIDSAITDLISDEGSLNSSSDLAIASQTAI